MAKTVHELSDKELLERARDVLGTFRQVAKAVDRTKGAVSQWYGKGKIPDAIRKLIELELLRRTEVERGALFDTIKRRYTHQRELDPQDLELVDVVLSVFLSGQSEACEALRANLQWFKQALQAQMGVKPAKSPGRKRE